MKVLLAASEVAPFARTGGLGDVLEGLPPALTARGHEVSVVMPCYRGLREDPRLGARPTGVRVPVQLGAQRLHAEVLEGTAPNGSQIFLIRHDPFFDRVMIYGENGRDYSDNAERFIFFSKAVVELARRVLPPPDILHLHDWQTALAAVLVKQARRPFRTVLTIHDLAFQGNFWGVDFGLTNLPGDLFSAKGVEFYGNLNLLKGGILFADALTTVSERYAREIQTPEGGSGLDAVIRENIGKLSGILNGADYTQWNPATDSILPKTYTPANLAGKKACRAALLKELGLAPDPRGPVYAVVSRLTERKGIELLIPLLDRLLANDVRLVILGQGDTAYEREFTIASRRHAGRFTYLKGLDSRLSHLIEAGADISLIPSHFEPCGLTAMYSLKYGTLPVARATGGLHQIIQDYDPTNETGTGFLFYDYTPAALWDAIMRATEYHADAPRWTTLMQRAMAADFSWSKAVLDYEEVYARTLRGGS
jgi:starch synthase